MKRAIWVFAMVTLCFLYTLTAPGPTPAAAAQAQGASRVYDDFFDGFFDDDYDDWFGGYAPDYGSPGAAHRSFHEGDPEELDIYAGGGRLKGRALAGENVYLIPLNELAAYYGYTLSGHMEPGSLGGIIPLNVMITHYSDPTRSSLIVGNVEEGIPSQCDLYRADGEVQTAEVMVLSGELYLCAECAAFGMMIDCDIDTGAGLIRYRDSDTLPPPQTGEGAQLI